MEARGGCQLRGLYRKSESFLCMSLPFLFFHCYVLSWYLWVHQNWATSNILLLTRERKKQDNNHVTYQHLLINASLKARPCLAFVCFNLVHLWLLFLIIIWALYTLQIWFIIPAWFETLLWTGWISFMVYRYISESGLLIHSPVAFFHMVFDMNSLSSLSLPLFCYAKCDQPTPLHYWQRQGTAGNKTCGMLGMHAR